MPALPPADLEHVLEHTRDLWEPVRGQNIFVTGGTGFFGRWLLESFEHINDRLDLGARLTALTRDPEAIAAKAPHLAASSAIDFVQGDVRHLARKDASEFQFVIHAAMDSVGQTDPLATFDTIVAGTRAVLEFAAGSGARRFLFTSSGAVYGRQPPEMTHVPETYSGAPDCTQSGSAYGEGKRAAELLCASYHAKYPALNPVIARCFAFVGPLLPLDAHFAIGNFIRDALRGGPISIAGDGTPHRSYLYAADLAVWLWTLLLRGRPMHPYNVGSEKDVTILELASTVAECFSGRVEIHVAQRPSPGTTASRYVPSTRRAADDLALTTLIPLHNAIARTVAWHFASASPLLAANPDLHQP